MRNVRCIAAGSLIGALLFVTSMYAGPGQFAQPGLINYQGRLADLNLQKAVSDTLDLTFSLYDVPDDGTPLWTETQSDVAVWGGFFNVLLGSVVPIPETLFWDPVPGTVVRKAGDRWLGVKVGANSEMKPRQRIGAVAFAIHADVVDGRHATEFVSSVHPDSMTGVEWCSDDTTMLTVRNECTGGGIRGESPTDIGMKGVGRVGVLGLASQAGDTAVYGKALNPALEAGHFDGYVFVFGDAQLGSDENDFSQYLRTPGSDTWGYLFAPWPTDSGAFYIAYNYHVDSTGTGVFDNDQVGSATSQIRLGDGGLEFATGRICATAGVIDPPKRAMSVIPSGQIVFDGPLQAYKATFDTVNVGTIGKISQKMVVDGSVGIGTPAPAPDALLLHVKKDGSTYGSYGQESKGNEHIALFENTASNGDGIAIKVADAVPNSDNIYMSFVNGSGSAVGRVEGQDATDVLLTADFIYNEIKWLLDTAVSVFDLIMALIPGDCKGTSVYKCPPVVSDILANAAAFVALQVNHAEALAFQNTYYGVAYESGSGDYAEWLERMDGGERMEPGDIVGVFGGKVSKRTADAQQVLVVSAAPIVIGNMPPEQDEHAYEKVAFMGQVPVKVSGPVECGDYIIPSGFEDGTGIAVSPELMTADEFSRVVGRAWSGSHNRYAKLVTIAVGLNSGDVSEIIRKTVKKNRNMEAELRLLEAKVDQLKELEAKLSQYEALMERAAPPPGREQTSRSTDTSIDENEK